MAESRPATTTDGAKALAKEITGLRRRVRDLELRPDPTSTGGSQEFFVARNSTDADVILDGGNPGSVYWQFSTSEHQSGGFTRVGTGITGQDGITIPSAGLWVVQFYATVNVTWDTTFDLVGEPTYFRESTTFVFPGEDDSFFGDDYLTNLVIGAGVSTTASYIYRIEKSLPFYVDLAHVGGYVQTFTNCQVMDTSGNTSTNVTALHIPHHGYLALYKVGG